MVNLLLLAGNSPHNKKWIYQVCGTLAPLVRQPYVHEYAHWQTGGAIDFDRELAALASKEDTMRPYAVFAKSVGSVLALRGMYEGALQPVSCLFVGVPLSLIERENIPVAAWLREAPVPITIAQNDADPLGSFDAMRQWAAKAGVPSRLFQLHGDTHHYDDLAQLLAAAQTVFA